MKVFLKNNFQKAVEVILNKQTQNLLVYGLGQGFNLVTPLLVVPFIVSRCGVANFGKVSVAMAILFFLMVFIDFGSDIIGVKEVAVQRTNLKQLEKIFVTTFTTKFILLIIVLSICAILFSTIPFFNSEKQLFFLGLTVLVGQFINPTWYFQGVENFKGITTLTIISKIIYLSGIFWFIHQSSDYVYINFLWGIGTIIANGIAFFSIIIRHGFSFKNTKKSDVLELLKSNFSMFFSQIFVSLQMYAPIMLIGVFGNNFMAGQYKIIDQIIVVFKTYIYLFFNFVYPRVCYLIETNKKVALRFWKRYNGFNFLFIAFAMTLLFIFSSKAICFFTKKDVLESSDLLKMAVLIPILLAVSIPLKQLILGFDKQKIYIRTTMIMVLVNMVLMAILLRFFNIYGVFSSLILTEISIIIIYSLLLKYNFTLFKYKKN